MKICWLQRGRLALSLLVALAAPARAQAPGEQPATAPEPPATEPAPDTEPATPPAEDVSAPSPVEPVRTPRIQIHGFVSEGGFISTDNDYIGKSSRGSLELFEVGLNVSTEVANKLRAGLQLFARDAGVLHDTSPRVDWAYLDYAWRPWLGLRAGVIKMPFGLYNEYIDIDAARVPILLPQSLYPFRTRDALISHRGFSLYGTREVGGAGELDYQAWLGTLIVPGNALTLQGGTLDRVDTKYVAGGQLFWRPPFDGLRVGATLIRASIDFYLHFTDDTLRQLVMAGLVPADYDGALVISQRPDTFAVGSAEYTHGDWILAAEYARTWTRQRSSLPALLPTETLDSERLYSMVSYQASPKLAVAAYYSVTRDADDRGGHSMKYAKPYMAWQRDAAAAVRFDVNDHWLWKIEAHFIDGTSELDPVLNADPVRYWGLFLARTTVTF